MLFPANKKQNKLTVNPGLTITCTNLTSANDDSSYMPNIDDILRAIVTTCH